MRCLLRIARRRARRCRLCPVECSSRSDDEHVINAPGHVYVDEADGKQLLQLRAHGQLANVVHDKEVAAGLQQIVQCGQPRAEGRQLLVAALLRVLEQVM